MILADSSIWIDHFRMPNGQLAQLIRRKRLFMHPFVVGELALGSLRDRPQSLADLNRFPQPPVAHVYEVSALIEREHLFNLGIGYVDVHLIASTLLAGDCRLWTRDRRLHNAAERLGVAA